MNIIKFSLAGCIVLVHSSLIAATAPDVGWTGFYVGVNGGYSNKQNKAHTHLSTVQVLPSALRFSTLGAATSVTAGAFSLSSTNQGFIGGGQIGYIRSFNPFVLGLEADLQGVSPRLETTSANQTVAIPTFNTSKIASHLTYTQGMDYLGTVRGRLGILATPSLLIAATGGYAYGGVRADTQITQDYLGTANNLERSFTSDGGAAVSKNGWTAGGTLEWRIQKQWSTKLEYLYYDLGSVTYSSAPLVSLITGGPDIGKPLFVNAVSTTSHFNGQLVRIGINYLLA